MCRLTFWSHRRIGDGKRTCRKGGLEVSPADRQRKAFRDKRRNWGPGLLGVGEVAVAPSCFKMSVLDPVCCKVKINNKEREGGREGLCDHLTPR